MSSYKEGYDKMEAWLAFLQKRNRKEITLRTYRSVIRNFIGFLHAEGKECDPERMTEDDVWFFVRNYIATENTIHQYISITKEWMSYWKNPVIDGMGLLWNDNGHPNVKWVEEYELKKMLSNCTDPTERMILILGARCGCRCDEIANLKDEDYDGRNLRIVGKGHGSGKVRTIPLTESISDEIDNYIRIKEKMKVGRKDRSEGHLLILPVGKNYVNTLKKGTIYTRVKDIAARSGVSCSTHSLRRFFATNMAKRTKLSNVQTLMGHANINTTAKYLQRDMNELREAMEEGDKLF